MMDGRVGKLRQALDARGFIHVGILAYSAKVRIGVLRPVPRCGGLGRQPRQGRQEVVPDGSGQRREALHEVALDSRRAPIT
jgi:porphobilinogen synthase